MAAAVAAAAAVLVAAWVLLLDQLKRIKAMLLYVSSSPIQRSVVYISNVMKQCFDSFCFDLN